MRKEAAGLQLTGYIAALAEQGPTRGPQNVFINRRIVKDRTIAHAIIDAYSTASIKERSPEVHLFIEMPPDALDVNVHPTKAEVRFREQSLVHEVVRRALMDALGQSGVPQLQLRPEPMATPPVRAVAARCAGRRHVPEPVGAGCRVSCRELVGFSDRGRHAVECRRGPVAGASATRVPIAPDMRPLIPLGQFRDTFIIAVDDEGVAIIDQHVAHERVLFERVMERLPRDVSNRSGCWCRCFSTVGVRPSGAGRPPAELERLGFEVDGFGDATIKVSAVPALLNTEDQSKALRALAEDLEGLDRGAQVKGAAAHRRDDGVPCGGQGERPAVLREDDPHPRRAARDCVFHRLPARPPGDAAADAARDREELRSDLNAITGERPDPGSKKWLRESQ